MEAIFDSLVLLTSSGAMGKPVPEVLKNFLTGWAVLKYLSLDTELVLFTFLLVFFGITTWLTSLLQILSCLSFVSSFSREA